MLILAIRGFIIVMGFAAAAAGAAFAYGLTQNPQPQSSGLASFAALIGVSDVPAFVRVAYIHNAGYLGGLVGIVAAAMLLWRKVGCS